MEHWKPLLAKHRMLAVGILFAAAAALGIVVLAQRDTRIALFARPLDAEQMSEVATQLAVWNVPFLGMPDNVRVESGRRSELLLRLSLVGIPHAHLLTSQESLAGAGPLTPQSVLDEQQIDGLAGDLALDLRGVAGVSDARVIIAPAKPALFADDVAHEASASVRLTLQTGTTLTHQQVEAIRAFIASGVPGLEKKRVAILDDRGALLERDAATDEAGTLQASLQSALDSAFGSGVTIVRVRAIYDAQAHDLHEVRRVPLESRPIGTSVLQERYSADRKQYSKTQSTEDRGSDLQDERTQTPAGVLARLYVAVMVDEDRHLDLAKLRGIATAAVGLSAQRGDTLSVEELAFAKPPSARVPPWLFAWGWIATLAPSVLALVGTLIVFRWSAKPLAQALETWQQRAAVRRASSMVAGFAPAQVRGALHGEPPHTAAAIISALPTATATAVLEMYPPEERAAIVRRMQRTVAPIVPDYRTLIDRA